jgi:hypothetical protein
MAARPLRAEWNENDCARSGFVENSGRMKVFIQRSGDRLFLKADRQWTASKEEARDFKNCTPAIDFCVESGLEDVRLWVSFDDPKYDFPMEVFRAETKMLVRKSKELRERGRALLAELDQEQAEAKERKKLFPFVPDKVSKAVDIYPLPHGRGSAEGYKTEN